jgi:hypothetical protein
MPEKHSQPVAVILWRESGGEMKQSYCWNSDNNLIWFELSLCTGSWNGQCPGSEQLEMNGVTTERCTDNVTEIWVVQGNLQKVRYTWEMWNCEHTGSRE